MGSGEWGEKKRLNIWTLGLPYCIVVSAMIKKQIFALKTAIPKEYRERFEEERLHTNLDRMFWFAIYVVFLQITLNVLNVIVPQISHVKTQVDIPLNFYIILSLLTLLVGIVYWVLIGLARKGKIKSRKAKSFLINSLIYLYSVITMTFCTFNILTHQGINGQVTLILLVGMVPILAPLQSIVTISASAVYALVVVLATQWNVDTAGYSQWSLFFMSDMRAYFFIINGLTILVSVFIYRLYVSNFIKSVEMEKINLGLEEAVRERTRKLEEKTLAAEAASRAKSRFLTSVSHEIRTPLNAIAGMALIAERSDSIEKARSSAREISKASSHLLGLINDILDMSNIEEGTLTIDKERFLIQRSVQEVAEMAKSQTKNKAITLNCDFSGLPDIAVLGDKLRLKQVLISLLDNAVRYTQEDGHIAFKAWADNPTGAGGGDSEIMLFFSVTDDGVGMDDEQLSRLFVAFEQGSTANMKNRGLGLSLAISQTLVNMMGGTITAKSEPGKGSVFSFNVCLKKAVVEAPGALVIPDLSGKHILSVEDIEINRIILAELLAETHAEVDEAVDGLEAVEKFVNSPEGYYSFVFMDLLMPNMNGYEATKCIRSLNRKDAASVPIVALTANAYAEDAQKSMEAGMNRHLVKPVDFAEIMRVLAEEYKA